ncbi:MAG: hypothetical protein PHQ80_03620 [Candidatus ainarchaeum sp.]|nr:hypothetical protein [Candidatus ainarchaeum sp.]MDD5096197.1 hypothetical protein [Candidatus ainarchaeum sp.]
MTRKPTLNELVSLTFDSNPQIRKQAAAELARYEDPAANFALLELTYDKDASVSALARTLLDSRKVAQPELMSFAEVFKQGADEKPGEKKSVEEERKAETAREKMMKPLQQLMEKKLGKEKAAAMRSRMLPTLEKIYMKALGKNGQVNEQKGKAVQEMLTDYLDVISGADTHVISDAGEAKGQKPGIPEKGENNGKDGGGEETGCPGPEADIGLESVGTKEPDMGRAGRELAEMETDVEDVRVEELPELKDAGGGTMFRLAYDTMMASEGDEDVMKKAMQNMLRDAEAEIKLAFRVAKDRHKQMNITHLTELKSGMRNVNTAPLTVKGVEQREYQRTKKLRDTFTKIVVADDEGSEGVIYLFDNRGALVREGMRIKVEKALAKTFSFTNETALTLGKKGIAYIIL